MRKGKKGKDEISGEEKYQEKQEAAVDLKMNCPHPLTRGSLLVKLGEGVGWFRPVVIAVWTRVGSEPETRCQKHVLFLGE